MWGGSVGVFMSCEVTGCAVDEWGGGGVRGVFGRMGGWVSAFWQMA